MPEWSERKAKGVGFIPYLNFMLRFTHAEGEEALQLERFARIGIIAGVPRAPRSNTGAIAAGIARARIELERSQALLFDETAIIHQI